MKEEKREVRRRGEELQMGVVVHIYFLIQLVIFFLISYLLSLRLSSITYPHVSQDADDRPGFHTCLSVCEDTAEAFHGPGQAPSQGREWLHHPWPGLYVLPSYLFLQFYVV